MPGSEGRIREITEQLKVRVEQAERERMEADQEIIDEEITFLNAMVALATLPVTLSGFNMHLDGYKEVRGTTMRSLTCTFRASPGWLAPFTLELPTPSDTTR